MSGWMDKTYLQAARILKKNGIPVIAGSDTQWKGNIRQKVAGWIAPWYLHKAIDVLWVTGERQKVLANYLGYKGQKCKTGFYACDWQAFACEQQRKFADAKPAFLYVGRLIERKGIDTLLQAYDSYRQSVSDPWELWVAGTGELEKDLNGKAGVKALGFLQPKDLPSHLKSVGGFVLPSKVEPWGVALQEAAASGLPLIASEACGAGVHLVKDGFNGFVFKTGNHNQLSNCLQKISSLSPEKWEAWSHNSYQLSRQYTPEIWAETLMDILDSIKSTQD